MNIKHSDTLKVYCDYCDKRIKISFDTLKFTVNSKYGKDNLRLIISSDGSAVPNTCYKCMGKHLKKALKQYKRLYL